MLVCIADEQSLKLWLQHAMSADVLDKDIGVCYMNVLTDGREMGQEKWDKAYFYEL
jgi:hypothetical protein